MHGPWHLQLAGCCLLAALICGVPLVLCPAPARAQYIPPVSGPACAYCGGTNNNHASDCPYCNRDDDAETTGGYSGGGSPLGNLIFNVIQRLFAPTPGADHPELSSGAQREALKRRQAEFTKAVSGALGLLGNRPGVDAAPLLPPGGSAMFGANPAVVEVRNLRRACYFAHAVETAATEDVPLLLDEALKTANGAQSSFGSLPNGAALPDIDDTGLLAFQRVNLAYAGAYDALLRCRKNFTAAQQHRELVYRTTAALRAEVEKNMAGKTDEASRKKKQDLLAEIDAVVTAEDAAWLAAKAQLTAAEDRADTAREESVRVLRALALGKDPAGFHPPIASLPALTDAAWQGMQNSMAQGRGEHDAHAGKLQKELASFVPPLQGVERVHEGVILGFGTDAFDAQRMARDGVSCFNGKSYAVMQQEAAQAHKEGKEIGGAVVVSFGTPEQKKDMLNKGVEAGRVALDHLTTGEYSLTTPEGQKAVQQLAGKSFDRLVAHSNGATVAEALIRKDIITVNELDIMGGDRSLLNGHAYQELLDSGKVKRVVVWVNLNDPVPWITSGDQLKLAERGEDAAIHLAKKITGELAGGDARIEYRFMWGADYRNPKAGATSSVTDKLGSVFAAHFVESSYYPGVANELGVKYAIPKRVLNSK